jgi:hypothetical protein
MDVLVKILVKMPHIKNKSAYRYTAVFHRNRAVRNTTVPETFFSILTAG